MEGSYNVATRILEVPVFLEPMWVSLKQRAIESDGDLFENTTHQNWPFDRRHSHQQ